MRFQFVHFGPCQHELDALLTSAVAHQAACSIASKSHGDGKVLLPIEL